MFTPYPGNSDGSKLKKTKRQATPTERQATPKICVGGGSAITLAAARRERGPSRIPVPNRSKYDVMDKVFPMAQRGKAPLAAKRTCLPSQNMPADLLYQGMIDSHIKALM